TSPRTSRAADAPVVEEEDARLLARHVVVDGDDGDAGAAEGLEHALQLGLAHGEVAVDYRAIVGAGEGGPGVDAHRAADLMAVHTRDARDRHLVDAVLEVALVAEDGLDLLRVERR